MIRFRRLGTRIAFYFVLLLILVQAVAFVLVNAVNHRNALAKVDDELTTGERIFQRLLANNQARLTLSASVLAGDFALREALASDDAATIASALRNHGDRIHAGRMMLIGLDQRVRVDPLAPERAGRQFEFPQLMNAARDDGTASQVVLLSGRPYQLVVVPVQAPLPIAWVALGFEIDHRLAADFKRLSSLDVSFVLSKPAAAPLVLASSFEAAGRDALAGALTQGEGDVVRLADADFETRRISLYEQDGQRLAAIVQRPLAEVLAPFERLRIFLLLLAAVSIPLSAAASVLLARGIARPLRALELDAQRIQMGDYSRPIVSARQDDIGDFARSLDHMRKGIDAREREIMRLAYEDTLTGLPNRHRFNQQLVDALVPHDPGAGAGHAPLAVLMMDLNRFKAINDALGHAAGDEVLRQVAARLRALICGENLVARLGGDEFALLLPGADAHAAFAMAHRIAAALRAPVDFQGQSLDTGASVGIALCPVHGTDAGTLLRHADFAMYVAKRSHDDHALYDPRHDRAQREHLSLLGELRRAVDESQLRAYYQPKICLVTGRICGVEALVRWHHPSRGLLPPVEFMPYAEQTGFVRMVTRWMLDAAIRQCSAWHQAGTPLPVAINISVRDLMDPDLALQVDELLQAYGLPPEQVTLEITEGSFMEDPMFALVTLGKLDTIGVRLSIDDFGTGFSSLAYLKKLPVDELKIDRNFVAGMAGDSGDRVIVQSTIDLAHNLGLKVVAEGIEDEACLAELCRLKCDSAQGFLMSRPLPVDALEAWLVDSPWGRAMVTERVAQDAPVANAADRRCTPGTQVDASAGRTLVN